MTGDNKAGWEHVVNRHFNSSKNASQFTISQSELKSLLQTKEVVSTPVTKILQSNDGVRYVREVSLGKNVGVDKFTGQPTSTISVLTDRAGNLITATLGLVK